MDNSTNVSRRDFLKGAAVSGLGAGALLSGFQPLTAKSPAPNIGSSKIKNFILMVSDGMNNGTFSAANHWLNLHENRDSSWMQLYNDNLAIRRLGETACADSIVTDSAAASSAWGIGERVNLHSVNVTPSGKQPTPIAVRAKANGKSVGMVTTARMTHATPAGFAANVPHRDQDPEIAVQYLERDIDVLLGGGDKHFNPEKREDGLDLYQKYETAGYEIVKDRQSFQKLAKTSDAPLLGIFANDHIPYYIDRQNQSSLKGTIPCLEEMSEMALHRLSQNPNGFLLQIEAGRIDHAAHANDPATIIPEQLEFDRTIAAVRKFAEGRDDTLVIVTTDHGTGGFMLCGADDGYENAQGRFAELIKCKASYAWVQSQINPNDKHSSFVKALEYALQIQLTGEESELLKEAIAKPVDLGMYSAHKNIMDALAAPTFKRFSVSWNCYNHTADLVEYAIFGKGSDCLPGYFENWQVNGPVTDLLGI